jgi:hypothetical protein
LEKLDEENKLKKTRILKLKLEENNKTEYIYLIARLITDDKL